MAGKLPRYRVSFGYICPMNKDKISFGKLEEKIFTFRDLEFFLQVLSPFNSRNWMRCVRMLRKGGDYRIAFDETTDYGNLKKVIRISR